MEEKEIGSAQGLAGIMTNIVVPRCSYEYGTRYVSK